MKLLKDIWTVLRGHARIAAAHWRMHVKEMDQAGEPGARIIVSFGGPVAGRDAEWRCPGPGPDNVGVKV